MNTFYDKTARMAVDLTAALVVSKGTRYIPNKRASGFHSDLMPDLRQVPKNCVSIIGRKQGRLSVVGLAKKYNPKKNALWVVKCACGAYETRHHRAIMNPANSRDCCYKCSHLEYVKGSWNYYMGSGRH